MKNRMADIERMIHIANNEKPPESTVTNYLCNMIGKSEVREFKYFTVSTFKNGPHTLAKAADILISGERAMQLFEKARQIGFSGIGLNQKGPHHKRFVHVDTVDRRALWSY